MCDIQPFIPPFTQRDTQPDIQPVTSIQAPTRRRLLAAGMLLIGAAPWQRAAANDQPALQARLLQLVTQPDARAVGWAVWPALGQPTREALSAQLGHRLHVAAHRGFDALHQAFEQAVQADFAAGRCLQVSGWVLARTEVELCALAALAAPKI